MAYKFVTVTGKYLDETLAPVHGLVQFNPSVPIVDTVNLVTLSPNTQDIPLDPVTGMFTVSLLAMDNVGLSAFIWCFIPNIQNVPSSQQWLSVLFANGASQNIINIPSVPSPFAHAGH